MILSLSSLIGADSKLDGTHLVREELAFLENKIEKIFDSHKPRASGVDIDLAATTEIAFKMPPMYTSLTREELWNELMAALKDSESSAIWPVTEILKCEEPEILEGSIVLQRVAGSDTVNKVLIENLEKYQFFTYAVMEDHPAFREDGGATVSIKEDRHGVYLDWDGRYYAEMFKSLVVYLRFRSFVNAFHKEMSRKLREVNLEFL